MYRHNHVCQMDLFEGFEGGDFGHQLDGKVKLRHDESFIMERKNLIERKNMKPLEDCSSSVEMEIKHLGDNADEKFRELSGYFVVDKDFKFSS